MVWQASRKTSGGEKLTSRELSFLEPVGKGKETEGCEPMVVSYQVPTRDRERKTHLEAMKREQRTWWCSEVLWKLQKQMDFHCLHCWHQTNSCGRYSSQLETIGWPRMVVAFCFEGVGKKRCP